MPINVCTSILSVSLMVLFIIIIISIVIILFGEINESESGISDTIYNLVIGI